MRRQRYVRRAADNMASWHEGWALVVVIVVLSAVGHGRDGETGAAGAALVIALVVALSLRSLLLSDHDGGGEEHDMSSSYRRRRCLRRGEGVGRLSWGVRGSIAAAWDVSGVAMVSLMLVKKSPGQKLRRLGISHSISSKPIATSVA